MGGQASAVSDATVDIFLESAFFSPDTIAGKARRLTLSTDSSYRFERGVDFAATRAALERATQLLLEICGGAAGEITEVTAELPQRAPIRLRVARVNRVLGIDFERSPNSGAAVPPAIRFCRRRRGIPGHAAELSFRSGHRGRSDRGNGAAPRLRQYPRTATQRQPEHVGPVRGGTGAGCVAGTADCARLPGSDQLQLCRRGVGARYCRQRQSAAAKEPHRQPDGRDAFDPVRRID